MKQNTPGRVPEDASENQFICMYGDIIRSSGLRLIPLETSRGGMNPLRELGTIFRLIRMHREARPDAVYQFALKPNLYGTSAARLVGAKGIVSAPVDMGYVFSFNQPKARLIRPLVVFGYR